MVPILICIPFITSSKPGYTCFVPNHLLLTVLSVMLIGLMLPIVILNGFDNNGINTGYVALILFVIGTVLFVTLGIIGMRRISTLLFSAAFWVWCLTWVGFLSFCTFSVWSVETLDKSTINGRCPLTLWLFDWCHRTTGIRHREKPAENSTILIKESFYEYNHSQENVKFLKNLPEQTKGLRKIENSLPKLEGNNENILKPDQTNTKVSENVLKTSNRKKRTITDIGVDIYKIYPSGPEYREAIGYYLGIFFMMLFTITLYTSYGLVVLVINNELKWPPPIIFIARSPEDGFQGAANTQNSSKQIKSNEQTHSEK